MDDVLLKRTLPIKVGKIKNGPVVYWMSRDQRADNNWALIYAFQLAMEKQTSVAVVFCLVPEFLNAAIRQYGFMLKGLKEVETKLADRSIPFFLLVGEPETEIPDFCSRYDVSHLVTDFDPLSIKRKWLERIASTVNCNIIVVDAHNIVPAFVASDKAEYGAYTLRPKIRKLLPEFLNDFPEVPVQSNSGLFDSVPVHWESVPRLLKVNADIKEVSWCVPGETAALEMLNLFLCSKFNSYATKRNDPNSLALSNLSPYLHFGQISAQHIVKQVIKFGGDKASEESFLEELIIRRELADNFCFYNINYDSFEGFPHWAKKTLSEHRNDRREHLYSQDEFEKAQTHDSLWNAAQMEMVVQGKMHGFMRMYWAKKILEWTASPEEALRIAIYLNDKYELDGRDPNGYAGCAWAIGGVHDRAWNKHPVYGMIRYMNSNGCRRKFDVDRYVRANPVKINESW